MADLQFANPSPLASRCVDGELHGIAGTGNIGVIISGCVVTFISGSNYSCSSGIVYLNGTFMFFPGWASTTLPQYIVAASPIVVTDTWANASTNNLTSDQQATYQGTIPGSGQYIGLTISGNIGYTIGGKRYENLNILGVADNTPAVGKQIGEIISTSNNSHTQATSGSYENVQIIVLSPGDWDLFANYTISS